MKSPSLAKGTQIALVAVAAFASFLLPGVAESTASHQPGQPSQSSPPAAKAKSRAMLAYEKFKALDGSWQGKSTKGWTERVSYRVIAGGSAVMETSFDAHPGEAMATMIHPDGEDLAFDSLLHGEEPAAPASDGLSEDGKTVTFTFMDATNLPSRDKGHMDKAVFVFEDADRFTCQWTWYQDGKEDWMEKIEHIRIKDPTPNQPPHSTVIPAGNVAAGDAARSDTQGAVTMAIPYDGGLTCSVQVKNLDKALKWYGDTLGFKTVYKIDDMGWAEMSTAVKGVNLGLSQVEKITGTGNAKLTFGVTDIDKARKELEGKGVKFEGPTIDIPGMVRLATFFDPDGNPAMFYQDLQKK